MLRRAFTLGMLFSVPFTAGAITIEVVKLYQPLSLHGTDGVGEEGEGGEALQAAVLSRPMAVSGAVPEDLVKAVAMPCKIPSNSPAYDVPDANLLTLCKVALNAEMKNDKLLVRLDLTELSIPEEVDLTSRQILNLCVDAIRKTLEDYFKHAEEGLEVSIGVIGTNEGTESLRDIAVRFTAGG